MLCLVVAAMLGHEVVAWGSAAFAAAFAGVALIVWLTMITPGWVSDAGDAYATRLLESAIRLPAADAGS